MKSIRLLNGIFIIGGGVKANSKDTLRKYTETSPEQLIIKGSKGIASWSKALTVIDPAKYFPPLKGRNTLINFFQIKIQPTLSQWDKFDDQEFYSYYLDMLNIVAHELGGKTTHHDIEMLLFSHAEELSFLAAAHVAMND